MAKINRVNGNVQAFASAAIGTERTIFGEITQSNDLTAQFTADFLRGWGIVGASDQPALEDFNGAMYTHGQLLAYLHQIGVPEYNAAQEYHFGSSVSFGGVIYISAVNTNVGNSPAFSPSQWVDITGRTTATSGSSPALLLTPLIPALSYTGRKFRVVFSTGSTGNDTINISGLGAVSLKQYSSSGVKEAAVFASGQISTIEHDGTDMVLLDTLPAAGLAPGDIKICAYSTPDAGYLKANGAAVSRITYSALFAKIGTTFGAGDGSTTFNLPDLRAEFVRGWDDTRNIDSGRVFGSSQAASIVSIGDAALTGASVVSFYNNLDDNPNTFRARLNSDGVPSSLANVLYTGTGANISGPGLDSAMYVRPRNVALLYCIKF